MAIGSTSKLARITIYGMQELLQEKQTERENGICTYTCTLCGDTKRGNYSGSAAQAQLRRCRDRPDLHRKGLYHAHPACGDSYVDTYTNALGHAWDNGKVTKEPTETETGVKTFTCTRCGETRTETMPVIPHVHSCKDVVTAPTCTEKGYTTHTCSCGDSYVDTYTNALGHAWDSGKVTKEPTATGDRRQDLLPCTRCSATKTETIPATGSVDVTQMFTDVTKNWAYPGIQYCVTHGIMGGMGNGTFAPTGTTTRAQIVQILYNLEGTPAVSGTTPFTDLTANRYKPRHSLGAPEQCGRGHIADHVRPGSACHARADRGHPHAVHVPCPQDGAHVDASPT